MCGIAGWVERDPRQEIDRGLLQQMTDLIQHRGPDAGGIFTEPGVGLGHRRLSIIDRAGGQQPMTNEDGSVWIVFNGEIYNFLELRSELIDRGHRFATRSDTEVILHGYEEFGPACLQRLRGMFAFAIWDRSHRQLLLARDRLGKKPLYYTRRSGALLFASEVKALLGVPGVTRAVNWEGLDPYLSLRYVPGPMTLFQDICKLMPGHFLLFKQGEVKVQSYWDVEFREEEDRDDSRERFESLLKESVRIRLMSEVPLGVFLSGGLDSSAIVAEMTEIAKEEKWDRPIQTFSVGYNDPKANEFTYAREVARHFQTDHHEFRLEGEAFRDFIPKMVWYLDEPMADASCVPLFFISQYAKASVTVVLSGEGADEILAGYGLYHKMRLIDRIQKGTPRWLLGGLARLLSAQRAARWRKYAEWIDSPLEERYWGVSRIFTEAAKRELLRTPQGGGRSVAVLLKEYYRKTAGLDPLNRMLYLDTKVWLPDQILLKADKMTMANSQELRVPFLDHHLVEFAATLPIRQKLSGGVGKQLLREAMAHRLPKTILKRSKKGFPIPAVWFRKEALPAARELFSERDSLIGEVKKKKVAQMLQEEEAHPYTRHEEIWTLLVLDYWHRIFIRNRGFG